jgi:hypothetical protein
MTYQDDPNINRRRSVRDETSYTGWIIGGLVALLVIAGIFMMSGRNAGDNTASNTPAATTGSAPGSGSANGTASGQKNAPASTTTPANPPTQNR